jgi:hypothetical protein
MTPARTAAASESLRRLRALVEDDSYGVPAYRYNGDQMADELAVVLRGLRLVATPPGRVAAFILPPILVDRVRGRAPSTA